jgi:hypothetical protein
MAATALSAYDLRAACHKAAWTRGLIAHGR